MFAQIKTVFEILRLELQPSHLAMFMESTEPLSGFGHGVASKKCKPDGFWKSQKQ